jgi:antitoxin component of MazEF toxin-antitoxin module
MEATVVKIGTSLGVKIPDTLIINYNLKVGTKVDMNFIQNDRLVLREKPKNREGWDVKFAQYALNGEDKPMLPDFLDSETDVFL